MIFNQKKFIFILIFLLLFNFFCWAIIIEYSFLKEGVYFLDIGQADSELIVNKAGNILIDAGSKKVLKKLQNNLPFFERTIDIFILSHPDRDHFEGIFDILNQYKIRAVVLNDFQKQDSLYQKFLEELKLKRILVIKPPQSIRIRLESNDSILVYPTNKLKQKSNSQNSLISLYFFKGFTFLFPGDIDQNLERQLIPLLQSIISRIEVLKVSHHGSKNSSSQEFLDFIKPLFAVIETGKNNYGHPHEETISRLKAVKASILRTDLDGSVIFRVKNNNLIYFLKKDKIY